MSAAPELSPVDESVEPVMEKEHAASVPQAHVPPSHTISTVAEWLAQLPPSQRDSAEHFVASYGEAYQFDRSSVRDWMLAHGFPRLESVGAFDAEASMARCDTVRCTNAEEAALLANHHLDLIDSVTPEWVLDSVTPPEPSSFLRAEELSAAGRAGVLADGYIRIARQNGATLFAAYLEARNRRLRGDQAGYQWARAFLAACGDQRVSVPIEQSNDARQILSMTPLGTSQCGFRPGMPTFPAMP